MPPTELSFKTPTVRQALGQKSSVFVFFSVVFFIIYSLIIFIVFMLLARDGNSTQFALCIVGVFLFIPPAIFVVWICLLSFGKGRILLKESSLVQYDYFNQQKEFDYTRIFDVRRGRYMNRTIIYYYPLKVNGEIEFEEIRKTRLITVHRYKEMRNLLRQLIRGPQPDASIQNKFTIGSINWRLLILFLILVASLSMLVVVSN